MKSTILQIIVKEWFKDRLGGELDDGVLEAIIKELTEKKDNPITITDIEPRSNRIHYESKKDLEAKENKTNYYSEIQMSEAYDKGAYDQTNQSGHFNIHNYKPEFTKESDWIGVEDKMPEVKGIQSEQITFLTLGDKIIDGYSNGRKFYDADGIIHRFVTHWKYKNNEPKEEEQTFITETQTMFIVEVKMLSSDKKIYHVLNSKNKEEAVSKVREHYKLEAKFNARYYVIDIIDYEFIN